MNNIWIELYSGACVECEYETPEECVVDGCAWIDGGCGFNPCLYSRVPCPSKYYCLLNNENEGML
jgi:hypothetical protein